MTAARAALAVLSAAVLALSGAAWTTAHLVDTPTAERATSGSEAP